jgi:hypothetical protein
MADKHGIEVVNEAGLARKLEATDARFDPAALEIQRDTRKLCPSASGKWCNSPYMLIHLMQAGGFFGGIQPILKGFSVCIFSQPASNG